MANVEKVGGGAGVGWEPVAGEQSEAKARVDVQSSDGASAATASWGAEHASHAATLMANLGVSSAPPPEPSLTDRIGGWFSSAASEVREEAVSLKDAATGLTGKVSAGVTGRLNAAASEASSWGGRLENLWDKATDKVTDKARAIGTGLVDTAKKAESAVKDGFNEVVDGAKKAGTAVENKAVELLNDAAGAAAKIRDKGKEILSKIDDALDPTDEIQELKTNGSTLTISLGASAKVEVGGKVKGECQVTRVEEPKGSKPKFSVQLTGEVAATLGLELGGKAGAKASAEAEVEAGLKGAITFECDSAEEAARIVKIAGRMAASYGVASTLPGVGTVVGSMLAPGADDMKFLGDKADTIELAGTAAGEIAAELGVGADKDKLRLIGADVGAGASVEQGISIKLPKNGKPAEITLKQSFEVSGKASVGAAGGAASLGAEGKLKVEMETKFTLPAKVDAKALRNHPLATIKGVAAEIAKSQEAKITLSHAMSGEAGASIPGVSEKASGEIETSVSFTAKPTELGAAFAGAVKSGSLNGALAALDKNIEVEAKIEGKTTHGFHIAPEISVMGVGIGVEAQYETATAHEIAEFKGSPSEALKKLGEKREQLLAAAKKTGAAAAKAAPKAAGAAPVLIVP